MKYEDLNIIVEAISSIILCDKITIKSAELQMEIKDEEVEFSFPDLSFPEGAVIVGNILISEQEITTNSDQIVKGEIPINLVKKVGKLPWHLLPDFDLKIVCVAVNTSVTAIECSVVDKKIMLPSC